MGNLYAPYDSKIVTELMGKSVPTIIQLANPSYGHPYEVYLVLATKLSNNKRMKNKGQVQSVINNLKFYLEKIIPDSQMRALSEVELKRISMKQKKESVTEAMQHYAARNAYRNHAIGAC
jgi:hypothetical protein